MNIPTALRNRHNRVVALGDVQFLHEIPLHNFTGVAGSATNPTLILRRIRVHDPIAADGLANPIDAHVVSADIARCSIDGSTAPRNNDRVVCVRAEQLAGFLWKKRKLF